MFVPSKNETKENNIPANAGNFLRKEIYSTDFKNENVTTKKRTSKAGKSYFSK